MSRRYRRIRAEPSPITLGQDRRKHEVLYSCRGRRGTGAAGAFRGLSVGPPRKDEYVERIKKEDWQHTRFDREAAPDAYVADS